MLGCRVFAIGLFSVLPARIRFRSANHRFPKLAASIRNHPNPEADAQLSEFRLPEYHDWKLKLSKCGGLLRGLGSDEGVLPELNNMAAAEDQQQMN
jgi:hypothetical protein